MNNSSKPQVKQEDASVKQSKVAQQEKTAIYDVFGMKDGKRDLIKTGMSMAQATRFIERNNQRYQNRGFDYLISFPTEREESIERKAAPEQKKDWYVQVNFLQFEEDTKRFSKLEGKGDYKTILQEARDYDFSSEENFNLRETRKGNATHYRGDDLLNEDSDYAVVVNNSIGGTYAIFRKVTEEELRDDISRQGFGKETVSSYDNRFSGDVKQLINRMANEGQSLSKGKTESEYVERKLTPEYASYLLSLTDMQRGRASKVLDTQVNYSGYGIMTRADFISKMVQEGGSLQVFTNGKGTLKYAIQPNGKESSYDITKIEADFADSLEIKKDSKYTLERAERNAKMEKIRKKYGDEIFYTTGGVDKSIAFYEGHLAKGHTLDDKMKERLDDLKEYRELNERKKLVEKFNIPEGVDLQKTYKNSYSLGNDRMTIFLNFANLPSDKSQDTLLVSIIDRHRGKNISYQLADALREEGVIKDPSLISTFNVDESTKGLGHSKYTVRFNDYNEALSFAEKVESVQKQLDFKRAEKGELGYQHYNLGKEVNAALEAYEKAYLADGGNYDQKAMETARENAKKELAGVKLSTLYAMIREGNLLINDEKILVHEVFSDGMSSIDRDWRYESEDAKRDMMVKADNARDAQKFILEHKGDNIGDTIKKFADSKGMSEKEASKLLFESAVALGMKEGIKDLTSGKSVGMTHEEVVADKTLSNGFVIKSISVFQVPDRNSKDYGKYMISADVTDNIDPIKTLKKEISKKTFDDFTNNKVTWAKAVEDNFGEELHLATFYQKFKFPIEASVYNPQTLLSRNPKGDWFVQVELDGHGKTSKHKLSYNDRDALFGKHTATKEQLAARYLNKEIQHNLDVAFQKDIESVRYFVYGFRADSSHLFVAQFDEGELDKAKKYVNDVAEGSKEVIHQNYHDRTIETGVKLDRLVIYDGMPTTYTFKHDIDGIYSREVKSQPYKNAIVSEEDFEKSRTKRPELMKSLGQEVDKYIDYLNDTVKTIRQSSNDQISEDKKLNDFFEEQKKDFKKVFPPMVAIIETIQERQNALTNVIYNQQNSTTMSEEKKPQVKQENATVEQPKVAQQEKTASEEVKHREPQLVTVNGEKVTHAHAYQSNKNPEDWFYTAKIDGISLRPQHMSAEDVKLWQEKNLKVEDAMQHYYPTKLQKKVTPEEYKADNKLSDGRTIDKMVVFKEQREGHEDVGRYKMYVEVGNRKVTKVMSHEDLNAYFDRVTTPAKLVEKNFGEQLNLASAYAKYQIPKEAGVERVAISKTQEGKYLISASGSFGQTEKKQISASDLYSLYHSKTATKEQLAAKYFQDGFKPVQSEKTERTRELKR